jgi:spore germination protein KA
MVDAALSINRGIEEPTNERALQGTHEGFIESLLVNLHLIRRQAATETIIVRKKKIGKTIKKDVAVVYMHDRASATVLAELMKKLEAIDQHHFAWCFKRTAATV